MSYFVNHRRNVERTPNLRFTAMSDVNKEYKDKIMQCIRAIFAAKYVRNDNVPCKIEEGLFLGSIGVAYNKEALKSSNITHVLVVVRSLELAFPNDFVYKKIDVLDTPMENLEQHFDDCFDFIEQAKNVGGSVLVHCFAGRSRSVTIVVSYLMRKHQMSVSQAIKLVRSKRPEVSPNSGFLMQLKNFEKSIQGSKS